MNKSSATDSDVTPYRIALTDARVTDSKIFCPFVSVCMRSNPFLMRRMRPVSGDIRFVPSYPLVSFGHVQNFERTPPDKYVRWVNVTHWHAVCQVLVRFVRFSYAF